METNISSTIVEKWLNAWALSRELPPPTRFKSGYQVNVGYENQKKRYVFPHLNNDFIQLAEDIDEPWVFLKVCASANEVMNKISGKWVIQPQGYMMNCNAPMNIQKATLPPGYKKDFYTYNSTTVISITTDNGEPAATGRIIVLGDLAVYDRVSTEENHRRKGIATYLIGELEQIAVAKNVYHNFLVATEQGKLLYQTLGWKVYSLYTSIVIPG